MDISDSVFTKDGFAAIVSFTHLHQLTLKYLASLNLRSLNLYGTPLDERALQHLVAMRSLRLLFLGEKGLSIGAIENLNGVMLRMRCG